MTWRLWRRTLWWRFLNWLGKPGRWWEHEKTIKDEARGIQHSDTIYTKEFQLWWCSGLRKCYKHPYPQAWHIIQSIECPKCKKERIEKKLREEKEP